MILTGKCKEKFLEWLKLNYPLGAETLEWSDIRALFLNALIIEWFDSVGIYIENTYSEAFDNSISSHAKVNKKYVNHEVKDYPINIFNSCQEATIQEIKKANDIYNSRYENV